MNTKSKSIKYVKFKYLRQQKKSYSISKISIKKAKLDDLKKLQKFIPDNIQYFYSEIMMWPTKCGQH